MTEPVRLGIIGTGGIGKLHAGLAASMPDIDLVALSGLDDDAEQLALTLDVELYRRYQQLGELDLDGVVVATPNHLHLEMAAYFADLGVHLLVEKPIADSVEAGWEICRLADEAGVYLLVGHHRRHHSLVQAATELVRHELGRLVATNTLVTMCKPNSYYEIPWRRTEAAGPLLVNLVHEVDLQRAVCGEIDSVQAASTKVGRDFAFDDTAAIVLHFRSGALGTVLLSESTPSPWSWEAAVSDGMGFHNAGQDHAHFVGTEGSLSFPSLTVWNYDQNDIDPGWTSPLVAQSHEIRRTNPYVEQLTNFAQVIRGKEEPLVSGRDGLRSLAVVNAVIESARTGGVVGIDSILG